MMDGIDYADEREIGNDQEDERENRISDTFSMKFYKKRNRTPAFVTEFTNGRVTSDGANVLKFESFKSTADTRCLSANNGRLSYTGLSTNNKHMPLQYFVGVRNKKTGKMKLYDTRFFRMKPILKANTTESESIAPSQPESYWENLNKLTENFGSKTKKRAMNSNIKHAVSSSVEDTVPIDDIASVHSTPEITPNPTDNMDYLPPQNREADDVHDVFDINSIISPQEDAALDIEVGSLSDEDLANKMSSFNKFVSAHFERGNLDITKTKYLIYYNYLVQFQQLRYQDLRKKDFAPNIPDPYKSKFVSNFTVESLMANNKYTRSLPQSCKDKLIAYILVLALIIDDFTIDLSDIGNDLKAYGLTKLAIISQALGCHVNIRIGKDGAKTKVAILKLPLYVMTLKHARKTLSK